jgi:hypothetical protein
VYNLGGEHRSAVEIRGVRTRRKAFGIAAALAPNPGGACTVLVERVNARYRIVHVSGRRGIASQPTSGVEPFDGARPTTTNARERRALVKAPPAGTVRGVGVRDHD